MGEYYDLTILVIGAIAGLIGALTGLGGGIIVIPFLTLIFHIPIYEAMAAGLIATITTSSAAAATLIKQGYTNIKLGMFLEVGTVIGALLGAWLVVYLPIHAVQFLFGITLLLSAITSIKKQNNNKSKHPDVSDPLAIRLHLVNTAAENNEIGAYAICRLKLGFFVLSIAGFLSGLLGIGSGTVKVLAMDQIMHLPYRVATATSNFIIGVTATASIGIYWSRGYVSEKICAPVLLGVLLGALLGGYLLAKINTQRLRLLFAFIIVCVGVQMVYKGLGGVL
jgi:hypothetical protein